MDGSGYPLGLEGKDLTVGQRIVAIADIVEAHLQNRSYKRAYSKEHIEKIINNLKVDKKSCRDCRCDDLEL